MPPKYLHLLSICEETTQNMTYTRQKYSCILGEVYVTKSGNFDWIYAQKMQSDFIFIQTNVCHAHFRMNIFDSAFHFVTSRAARAATAFHFQFNSAFYLRGEVPGAFHLRGEVPGKVPVRRIPTRLPVSFLLRLDKHVTVQPLKM